jgi:two-component system chemotaxis response regulator CheB
MTVSIRVLIIDDSPTMRAVLAVRLSGHADIQVVGLAGNAAEGRAMIKELEPDVVTLDIEMPGMNGLEFLGKIMSLRPMPVIIVSGLTQDGSDATAQALALGAVDCYCKVDHGAAGIEDDGGLAEMVRNAARVQVRRRDTSPITAPLRKAARGRCQADRHWFLDRRGGGVAGPALQLSTGLPAHHDRPACGQPLCPRHRAHAQRRLSRASDIGRTGYAAAAGPCLSGPGG